MAPPVLSLRDISLNIGGQILLQDLTLHVGARARACLVGRNGAGKSTIMRMMAGLMEPDSGERFVQPGVRVGYLPQEPPAPTAETAATYIEKGALPDDEGAGARLRGLCAELGIRADSQLSQLSGGERRRVAIAQVLMGHPDVLLLDEPTNHLDIPMIEWLEQEVRNFPGAVVVISHDRSFLQHMTRQVYWLDRGRIRTMEGGFHDFDDWADGVMAQEEAERARLADKLAREEVWLRKGVTARRRRNVGRLRKLHELREARSNWLAAHGKVSLKLDEDDKSGSKVIEARKISKSYEGRVLFEDFSLRVNKGDRIGFVGPNGCGKTTLVRVLLGELKPDDGNVKQGTNLRVAYFDQTRMQLNPQRSLWETLIDRDAGGGGDSIFVRGRPRHVVSYLKEFLFDERQARSPVSSLSGGERTRLLLAKLFAQPANLVVLDEPTNDLDLEMLDVLEEVLDNFEGTLLIISHDRAFIDRTVTSLVSFEGDGRLVEYAGGYSDMLAQKRGGNTVPAPAQGTRKGSSGRPAEIQKSSAKSKFKLTHREQRALIDLPKEIAQLDKVIADLQALLATPDIYTQDRTKAGRAADELSKALKAREKAEETWLALELKREAFEDQ